MSNLKAKLKKEGGFTLIEMLIVVAIIAILIAISIPLVNKALESAREATDAANERSALGLAMVEIMTKNELAGEAIDANDSTKNVALYKISTAGASGASSLGQLVKADTSNVAGTSDGLKYGKGTKIGDVPDDHTNKCIQIKYNPGATTEAAQYEITWVPTTP